MDPAEAARVLGVDDITPWAEVRRAYLAQMRRHHPDTRRDGDDRFAVAITEAYRVLDEVRRGVRRPAATARPAPGPAPTAPPPPPPISLAVGTVVARLADDTLAVAAPADETFRVLVDAAHDVGEITYLDRSVPILEVLCRFVGEPATSLVLTIQGRAEFTEVWCTVESIEARPAPPTAAVVDLLEAALGARVHP